jgi:hypothetical protein
VWYAAGLVREGVALRTVFLLKLGREIFCTQEQIQATLLFVEHAFDILSGFRINRSGASAVAGRDFDVVFVIASAFVAVDEQPILEIVFDDRFGIERSNFESVRLIVNDVAYIGIDPVLWPIRGRTPEHRLNAGLSTMSIRDELFPLVAGWNVAWVVLPAKLLIASFLWMLNGNQPLGARRNGKGLSKHLISCFEPRPNFSWIPLYDPNATRRLWVCYIDRGKMDDK